MPHDTYSGWHPGHRASRILLPILSLHLLQASVKVNDTHGIVHVPSPIILSHVLFSDISVRRLRTFEEVTSPQEQR